MIDKEISGLQCIAIEDAQTNQIDQSTARFSRLALKGPSAGVGGWWGPINIIRRYPDCSAQTVVSIGRTTFLRRSPPSLRSVGIVLLATLAAPRRCTSELVHRKPASVRSHRPAMLAHSCKARYARFAQAGRKQACVQRSSVRNRSAASHSAKAKHNERYAFATLQQCAPANTSCLQVPACCLPSERQQAAADRSHVRAP